VLTIVWNRCSRSREIPAHDAMKSVLTIPRNAQAGSAARPQREGARAVILESEIYNFHRLDLTRQAGFIVTIFDEDGLRLTATAPFLTPASAFAEARKIVDGKVEEPKK
jgi:hypothetical protein